MASSKILLFLGSGATAGSGIEKCVNGASTSLPTDNNFFSFGPDFKAPLVDGDWTKKYPALHFFRNKLEQYRSCPKSLYRTWTDIFHFRSLVWAGIIEDNNSNAADFCATTPEFQNGFEHQRNHYDCQLEIKNVEKRPGGYYLGELAIWDLRVLIKEVYSDLPTPPSIYNNFLNQGFFNLDDLNVVNLNYDTTFDDFSQLNKKIIRPHGSLKWTTSNKFSIESDGPLGWVGKWHPEEDNTTIKDLGYRNANNGIFDFKQPHIVTPVGIKEEVIGNSSNPGLQDNLLSREWKNLAKQLKESDHWVFIGTSFASGDDHLLWLLERFKSDKKVCCSVYDGDFAPRQTLEDRLQKTVCFHKIKKGWTIDAFHYSPCIHS